MQGPVEAGAVRPGEALDWAALAGYLRQHMPPDGLPAADQSREMEVTQFPGGHSNLTYLVRFGATELVVRRPPLGPLPPTAHDMAREYRWLAALHPAFPLAPRVFLLCDDPSVIGSVFYVMERRRGVIVRREEPPAIADRPEMRGRVSEALVHTLADLHAIDVSRPPLSRLGKPAGFVGRQVRGWTERWHGSQTDPVPDMESLAVWLADRVPPDPDRPTVVHGDFKLDNVLLDADRPDRIVGVFDWEMSALGDPLIDLGIFLAYWRPTTAPAGPITDKPGWWTRAEIIDGYAARSGRDLSNIRFYETFALFKIAVVIQQIYCRYTRGQTSDPRFAGFGTRVASLARQAADLAA